MSFFDTVLKNAIVEMLKDIAQNCGLPGAEAATVDLVARMLALTDAGAVAGAMSVLAGEPTHAALLAGVYECVSGDGPTAAGSLAERSIASILARMDDGDRSVVDRYVKQMKTVYSQRG